MYKILIIVEELRYAIGIMVLPGATCLINAAALVFCNRGYKTHSYKVCSGLGIVE